MRKWFSHLPIRITDLALYLLLLLATGLLVAESGNFAYLFLLLLGATAGYFQYNRVQGSDPLLVKIQRLVDEIYAGNLEYRITGIPEKSRYHDIAWRLNETVDQFETFMREVDAVFKAGDQGRYHRHTLTRGVKGRIGSSLKNFDSSLSAKEDEFWNNKKNGLFSELGQLKPD